MKLVPCHEELGAGVEAGQRFPMADSSRPVAATTLALAAATVDSLLELGAEASLLAAEASRSSCVFTAAIWLLHSCWPETVLLRSVRAVCMARVTAWTWLFGAWPMLVATMLLRAWRTELTSWHTVRLGVADADADAADGADALADAPLEEPPPELQAARTRVAAATIAVSALFINTARLMSQQSVKPGRRAPHPAGVNPLRATPSGGGTGT
jgi:hypothetical protein